MTGGCCHGVARKTWRLFAITRVPCCLYVAQGKHGSLGGVCGGGWAYVVTCDAAARRARADERAAAMVINCLQTRRGGDSTLRRLNAHVVSLLSSEGTKAFQKPVEVVGRASSGFVESHEVLSAPLSGRLSSFGFSGTITHGLFCSDHKRFICSVDLALIHIPPVDNSLLRLRTGHSIRSLSSCQSQEDY